MHPEQYLIDLEKAAYNLTIALPDCEELMALLEGVSLDTELQKRFYPKILRHAGSSQSVEVIVNSVVVAFSECKRDLPKEISDREHELLPRFIEALTESNPVFAQRAREFYLQVRRH